MAVLHLQMPGADSIATPFHHLSGDSLLHRSLGAGPITASSPSISPYVSRTRCSAKLLRSGAPLIRDRQRPERSTQVGFTRLAHMQAPISGKPEIGVCSAPP